MAHGGQIEVRSSLGKGTTFTFTLPAATDSPDGGVDSLETVSSSLTPGVLMDLPKRILIVDDEPNVRLVFRTALEASGYVVAEAIHGEAALDQIRRYPADLILLDLKMPGMDGMETLRRLRDAGDDTPVVIVTAHGSIPETVAAMRLGAVDFIPKPVSPVAFARRSSRPSVAGSRPVRGSRDRRTQLESNLFTQDIARTRRALNRGEFEDAEFFLRIADALEPGSPEVIRLREDSPRQASDTRRVYVSQCENALVVSRRHPRATSHESIHEKSDEKEAISGNALHFTTINRLRPEWFAKRQPASPRGEARESSSRTTSRPVGSAFAWPWRPPVTRWPRSTMENWPWSICGAAQPTWLSWT